MIVAAVVVVSNGCIYLLTRQIENMKSLLEKLRGVRSPGCVTIAFNTHRTSPESQADVIRLKNLIREAQSRLAEQNDKKTVELVMAKLIPLLKEVDHTRNLDSMIIFANPEILELVRLPVPVTNRVEVAGAFSIRDLVRADNESSGYYVLVLSRRNARLFEAYNGQVVTEVIEGFPIVNEVIEIDTLKLTMASGTDNIIENFFKQVDNALSAVLNRNRLVAVVATEESNFHHFNKVTSNRQNIVGHLNRNRDDEEARLIAKDAWPIIHNELLKRNDARITDLKQAVSKGTFLSDLNDISRAVGEGRGRTLYVQTGYIQPAVLVDDRYELSGGDELTNGNEVVADAVEEIITGTLNQGGDVVFLDGQDLDKFDGLALLTRY